MQQQSKTRSHLKRKGVTFTDVETEHKTTQKLKLGQCEIPKTQV